MTTIEITYNERNSFARKTIDYILSLGIFKVKEKKSPAARRTLKVIEDARKGIDVEECGTFDDYLKAVAE